MGKFLKLWVVADTASQMSRRATLPVVADKRQHDLAGRRDGEQAGEEAKEQAVGKAGERKEVARG